MLAEASRRAPASLNAPAAGEQVVALHVTEVIGGCRVLAPDDE